MYCSMYCNSDVILTNGSDFFQWLLAFLLEICDFVMVDVVEYPVKNVTWILMEIPSSFSSQIDGISLIKLETKFHDYSMAFIQVLFLFHAGTWHGFWTSSIHGISMGFPTDLVSLSNQTKLPSKRHEKI